jgi:chromosome partitioning protein
MTKVIVAGSNKGGSGKTTTVLGVACRLHELGHSVAVLDVDPMASAADWADTCDLVDGESFAVQSVVGARLQKTIDAARASKVNYVIVDTAAKSEADTRIAFENADHILVLSRPSPLDLRGISQTVNLIDLAQKRASAHVVLNACAHSAIAADAEAAVRKTYGLPVCPVKIGQYIAFTHAVTAGTSITAFDKHGRAGEQIRILTDWVLATLKKGARA